MRKTCTLLLAALLNLAAATAAEIWQEAEDFTASNWPHRSIYLQKNGGGASGGLILELFTAKKPAGADHYYASYEIEIPADGRYALWAAVSNPASGWASPIAIAVDGQVVWDDPAAMKWKSGAFGAPAPKAVLGWINPGSVELKSGKHRIDFRVTRPRRDSNSYSCFFDGFLLTTSRTVRPRANYRISNLQPEWKKLLAQSGDFRSLQFATEQKLVRALMKEKAPCLRRCRKEASTGSESTAWKSRWSARDSRMIKPAEPSNCSPAPESIRCAPPNSAGTASARMPPRASTSRTSTIRWNRRANTG